MIKNKADKGKNTTGDTESERTAWHEKLQFLSDAMESTSQPFGAGSPEGSTMIFNEAFCKLTGYTRAELYHVNWATDLTTPGSRQGELDALAVLDSTHEPQRYEKYYRRKDSSIIPIELLAHVACDSQDNILFYYSFITDISVRKRREEEMEWANRAYKMLALCKQAMIRARDEPTLLNDICRIIVDAGGYRLAWFGMLEDDELQTVHPVARAGYDEGYVDNIKIALNDPVRGNGPTGISLKTGKPYGSKNVGSDKVMEPWRAEALKRGYLSTLNLPIMYEGQILGTLVIYSSNAGSFEGEELGLLQDLADNLAYGIKAMRDRARRDAAEKKLLQAKDELELKILERTSELQEKNVELEGYIQERQRSEEALQSTLHRFYTILSGMYTAILLVTEDGRIEYANQAFCDHFGFKVSPLELVGLTSDEMLDMIKGNYIDPERAIAHIREIVKAGKHVKGEEVAFTDGRTSLRDYVRLNVDGKPFGRLWLHVDITERKHAEDEIRIAKQQAELYLDLMGHDISNMHQIAMSQLELADEIIKDEGRLDDEYKELIETPLESLERSARLIDNVRNLQKLQMGELSDEVIDLGELLPDVIAEFGGVVPANAIKYTGHGPHLVKANRLLHDVFSNLVGNAIKHSGVYEPDIRINTDQAIIKGREFYVVSIDDNGPGIPDEKKGEVFHRFKRGQTKARGTGLGLYIVKTLVDSYGGSVSVEDRVPGDHKQGSRFVVVLPALSA